MKKFIEKDLTKIKVKHIATNIIQLLMKCFVSYKKEKWDEYLKYKIQLEHKIIEFK